MKIERMLYGMQPANSKIFTKYSDGAMKMLQPKSREIIKSLRTEDSRRYLWFKTEQTIAYPVIFDVEDNDGRTWVQNQTFLVNIHDFLNHYLNNGTNPFEKFVLPVQDTFPEEFMPIEV